MGKLLEIDNKKLEEMLLSQFYELVGEELGFDTTDETIRYDCRKIEIAKNIQDIFYLAYETAYPDAFAGNYSQAMTEVTMILALSGPKVNRNLPDNTVSIEEDFITFER